MTNSFRLRRGKTTYKSNGMKLYNFPENRIKTHAEKSVENFCAEAFVAGEPKVFFSAAYTADGHMIYIYNKSEYTSSMEALNVLDILRGSVITKYVED